MPFLTYYLLMEPPSGSCPGQHAGRGFFTFDRAQCCYLGMQNFLIMKTRLATWAGFSVRSGIARILLIFQKASGNGREITNGTVWVSPSRWATLLLNYPESGSLRPP